MEKEEISEIVYNLGTYAHIDVRLKEFPNMPHIGQFRGRIQDKDNVYYHPRGKAIWVTLDNGFELMANLDEIESITII